LKKIKIGLMVIGAFVLMLSTAAAAVTFDPETGVGFVGKGDVQDVFGWNNMQLQDNAADVSFTYVEQGVYTVVCSRVHQVQGYQEQTFNNREIGLDSEVEFEKRRNSQGQITGFSLIGFGEEVQSSDACPEGWPDEVSRTLNPDAGEVVGIFAHYDDDSHLIWSPENDE
jgi:hypothetical protein